MSHGNFVIPLNRDDLFEAATRNQYVVENVYNARDLKVKLQDCRISVLQQGADMVLGEGFDILFSLLREFNKGATVNMKQLGFETVSSGMVSLVDNLALLLNSGQLLETDEREESLNKFKMLLYLFCQLIEEVEGDQLKADPLTGAKQKGKKKTRDDDFTWEWDVERSRVVNLLYNLVQLNLNMLFDPPLIEEEVINLVANTMFKILENPVMSHQKTKEVRLSVIQVLGTLNKKFNYTLSCSLKFVQHLKHFEHIVPVFGQATEVMVKEFGCSNMVMELIREISRLDTKELARDTSGTRNYSLFLVDLAERVPESVKPCISLLTTHLDGESYSMRKCVLGVLGEIVARVLSGEDLDEAGKDDRDCFLDCLEDHMHDVHAHVRSYVLNIWGKLCQGKHIPLARQHMVLEKTAGRLQDKTSSVRKAAIQLLTSLLEGNPFAAKLETADLAIKLAEEKEKLSGLVGEEPAEPVEMWNDIKDKISDQLDKEEEEDSVEEKVWENASPFEVCERIAGFLEKFAVGKAKSLLQDAQNVMENEKVFQIDEAENEKNNDEPMEQEDADDENEKNENEKYMRIFQQVFLESKRTPEASQMSQHSQMPTTQEELTKQKMLVKFLSDSVKFSQTINICLPNVAMLLGSKQSTDVLEAIDFFVSAFEFGLIGAMLGVRKMLALIWSREPTIKDAVVAAYKRLYIEVESSKTRAGHVAICRNLIALVSGATLGELTSLEKLIGELVECKEIGKGVFTVLWEYFTMALPDSSPDMARSAITLLGMCAASESSLITSNIQVIIDHGLGERSLSDFRLAQHSCEALLRMVPVKLKQDDPNPPTKFDKDHALFKRLEVLLMEGIQVQKDPNYIPMAQNILALIYQMGEYPDSFAGDILKNLCTEAKKSSEGSGMGDLKVPTFFLRRFVFIAGHVALCQLNYLDVNVFVELKRRNILRDLKAKQDVKKKKDEEKKKKPAGLGHALETPRGGGAEDDDMGCVGAEADDAEAEFIRAVCEKEILAPENLLGYLAPLIVTICSNPARYPDPDLRASASMALSKFMLVSSEFCEKHLQLLFTVLEKAKEPVIRANLIIGLGDLSNRFPNTVEPWTPKMYARLHDEAPSVRINTLTVLTHLILNDMIKVKGQISDVAFCIVDHSERISGLAKLFFAELAKKGNTLYNVMPDIVSRLSTAEVGIDEEHFRVIMKYIIGLIEKDKLLESLVEKLCHRFRATRTPRQWRDIAYCLSLLQYSDRGIKKLNENFATWSDKLHEDFVYESICVILAGVKKAGSAFGGVGAAAANKGEVKILVEELEARVEEARAKGVEDDTADRRAQKAQDDKKKPKKAGTKGESSDGEDDVEGEAKENTPPPKSAKKKVETRRTRRRNEEEQVDSEDDN